MTVLGWAFLGAAGGRLKIGSLADRVVHHNAVRHDGEAARSCFGHTFRRQSAIGQAGE
jgi:hypothetical protein